MWESNHRASFCGLSVVTTVSYSWFQTFAVFCMLYVFFWVISRRLNFICRHFRILCLLHLHGQVGVEWLIFYTYLPMNVEKSVSKRRHIKFRRREITQKKTYNNCKLLGSLVSFLPCKACLFHLSDTYCEEDFHWSRWIWQHQISQPLCELQTDLGPDLRTTLSGDPTHWAASLLMMGSHTSSHYADEGWTRG